MYPSMVRLHLLNTIIVYTNLIVQLLIPYEYFFNFWVNTTKLQTNV